MPDEDLLNIDDAAKFLEVSKPTLYRLLGQDAIKGVKIGQRWRFRKVDLNAYLTRSPASVPAAPEAALDEELAFFEGRLSAAGSALPALPDTVAPLDETRDPADMAERKTYQLTSAIVSLAIAQAASDIHLDPSREASEIKLRIRIRIDGVLHDIREVPGVLSEAIIGRFKRSAGMDVAEKRLPQDGRMFIKAAVGSGELQDFDLRVALIPSIFGESMVMRILSMASVLLDLDRMGFSPKDLAALKKLLARPHGLIYCTGPTGSGKTTVLYSCIKQVNAPTKKILSIEDPVEVALPGIVQIPVNVRAGLTFNVALKSILRQDPDVILIGETRDVETVMATFTAALTGHLVLSTLHTEDAAEALQRLRDLGVEPLFVSGALAGITAQRLCRRLCEHCRVPTARAADDTIRRELVVSAAAGGLALPADAVFYDAVGCDKCRGGYRGRIAIYEVLVINGNVAAAYSRGATADEMRKIAVASGMTTMVADGVQKAADGLTTLDELARVIGLADIL